MTFAETTNQVALPIGRIGLLARIIPSANSADGGAALPANAAYVNTPCGITGRTAQANTPNVAAIKKGRELMEAEYIRVIS